MTTLQNIISELEQDMVENWHAIILLREIRNLAEEVHERSLEVGGMFADIRRGEDHPKITETRVELDKVYTPLARAINILTAIMRNGF